MFSTSLFAEWQYVDKNVDDSEAYINPDKVKNIDGYRYFFELTNFRKKINGAESVIVYKKIDCNALRFKVLNFNWYTKRMGKGEFIDFFTSYNASGGEWVYFESDSLGEKLKETICQMNVKKTNANSVEWLKILTGDKIETYIDVNSTRNVNDYIYVWMLTNFKESFIVNEVNFLSAKVYEQIECREGKTKRLDYRFYPESMGGGEFSHSEGDEKWRYAAPGSIERQIIMTICSFFYDN